MFWLLLAVEDGILKTAKKNKRELRESQMLKRMISLLLCAVMVLTMLPVQTLAADDVAQEAIQNDSGQAMPRVAAHTQDDVIAWLTSLIGSSVDVDGFPSEQPYQCVDLIASYYDYMGVPRSYGNGCDYATNPLPMGWQRIQNAVPQKGDVLVYSGTEANPYGHVAIYESDWSTYHQNFNYHPWVERVTSVRYDGFTNPYWGVIRPDFHPVPVSMSWGNADCQPRETDAFVYILATPNMAGTFTQVGINIWQNGTLVGTKTEYISTSGSYLEIWYNFTEELGITLTPNTDYQYQYFVVFNGETFTSPSLYFKTAGTVCTSHSFGPWQVTTAATCTTDGSQTHSCTVCGESQTQSIPAYGHNYQNGVCSNCGERNTSVSVLAMLQNKFPNGAYWNHVTGPDHLNGNLGHCGGSCNNPDGYTWTPCQTHDGATALGMCDCNVIDPYGGYSLQCAGFARKLAIDAYGADIYNDSVWAVYAGANAEAYEASSLKPGDVIWYYGGDAHPESGHWVMVIGVSGNAITIGECNVGSNLCQIRWGRVIYKDVISSSMIYSAPYALDSLEGGGTVSPITWTDATNSPGETDAFVYARAVANTSGRFTETGITLYNADRIVIARKDEMGDPAATTFLEIWFNITAELGIVLEPGTTYFYRIYTTFNGVRCESPEYSFITTGTPVPSFLASGNCSDTVSWVLDESYTLTISGTGAIPNGYTGWDAYKADIKQVIISDGITGIGDYAFNSFAGMTHVTIPDGVVSIGVNAFYGCSSLVGLSIPKSVESIQDTSFMNCSSMEQFDIDDDNDHYCSVYGVIYTKDLKTLVKFPDAREGNYVIPAGTTAIGRYAFSYCMNLESVVIPEGITNILYDTFIHCDSLERVVIPGSVTSIGMMAFGYCTSLSDIALPQNLKTIGVRAFFGCKSLTTLVIPESLTVIESSVFDTCSMLKEVTIMNGVATIGNYAFSNCISLKEIVIPESVSAINKNAFAGCTGIKTIKFDGDAPTIANTALEEVTATAYYPVDNETWTSDVLKNYGGTITWVPAGGVEDRLYLHDDALRGYHKVWIDGVQYAIEKDEDYRYIDLPDGNAKTMVAYEFHVGDPGAVHTQYPVSMKVWTLSNVDGFYRATYQAEFDDILQYSGSSIRATGKKGIRMITSMEQTKKDALTNDGLAGYTLKEYGSVIAWDSQLGDQPLVLGAPYAKSNYAYRKGAADPIFREENGLMQYTNVLVNFSDTQSSKDIAMRSYMILTDGENEITLYGGIVTRSIGYIAWQNRNAFEPGTESYEYIWDIIRNVYGDACDEEYQG